ncbi:MAG: hypothetical protein ACC657_03740 [Thiohalomonadales bacterium]
MLIINSKFFKSLFIILLSTIVLSSCAGLNQNKVSHLISSTESKVFKLVSVDESGNEINNRLIMEALQQNISKLSRYPNFYSAIEDISENISGFEAIISDNNSIKIQYLNGKLSASGKPHLTKVISSINIEIKTDNFGLFKVVTVHPPKSLYISHAKGRFSNIKTLDTPEKLQKDVEQIFKNIDLTMERLLFISGEIVVRNSDDEVFDNFEHKLGLYSKNSFQEKGMIFGIFELKSSYRKEIIPLRVRIFPDNKGSRVKYEFDVKYSIKSDATTTYDVKEINYLITTIKNVSTTKDLDAPIDHLKVNNKNLIAIIDDPVMISNNYKPTAKAIDIHKTSVTFKPRTVSKPKVTVLSKTKKSNTKPGFKKTSLNEPKSSNIKNIEYIEKMLSALKEKRPSK